MVNIKGIQEEVFEVEEPRNKLVAKRSMAEVLDRRVFRISGGGVKIRLESFAPPPRVIKIPDILREKN